MAPSTNLPPQTLNWGLLSTARINHALIPPLRQSKRNKLLAVASRSSETARAYAEEWHIPRAYGSYAELLADPDIHVIYNPLPNHLHAEWTVKALQAGKNVLCEKPLALSPAEVDDIIAASAQTGKIAAEAFMYRHHAQTLYVKQLVDTGTIGEIRQVMGTFSFTLERSPDVRLDPAMGGGSIWDIGCYPISYSRLILGTEPEEVFGWQHTGETGVDLTFVGQLKFPGNVFAQFDCSFQAPFRAEIEIVGSRGTIWIPNPYKPARSSKIFLTHEGKTEPIRIKGTPVYLGEVEDIADAVLEGKPPRVSLHDSRANVGVILALLQSAREGIPISCRL